jgi:hypothetical protein
MAVMQVEIGVMIIVVEKAAPYRLPQILEQAVAEMMTASEANDARAAEAMEAS